MATTSHASGVLSVVGLVIEGRGYYLSCVWCFICCRTSDRGSWLLPLMRLVFHDVEVGVPPVLLRPSLQTLLREGDGHLKRCPVRQALGDTQTLWETGSGRFLKLGAVGS